MMRKPVWLIAVTSGCLIAGVVVVRSGFGQTPFVAGQKVDATPRASAPPSAFGSPMHGGYQAEPGARSRVRQLVQQLSDATNGEQKAELTENLHGAIGELFDEDMKGREAQLTQLEERVKKLRAQLDRRRAAKASIVELQLKVLVNEAEGLGFSGTSLLGATYDDSMLIQIPVRQHPMGVLPPAPASSPSPLNQPNAGSR